jgi:hypothetical protein
MGKTLAYQLKIFNPKLFNSFIAILALIFGALIYILGRSSDFVFFAWLDTVGLGDWINYLRSFSQPLSSHLPDWIVFSLPDGLWAFAYSLIIVEIWLGSQSILKYFWFASIPLLVIGHEVFQYFGLIPGTFSFPDLAFETAGIIAGILIKIIKT